MTHIDTYSHRIPHKYTQIHTFYTHLHTNCHIFGWVTKNHTYIYISIYIYNKFIPFYRIQNESYHPPPRPPPTQKKKKFFNQKTKQTNENQNQIIHSIIDSFIQRLKESIEIHRNPQNPKIIEKQGYPPRSQKPTFSTFSSIFTTTPKNPFFHHFQTPKTHSKSIQIKKINEIHRKINSKSKKINQNTKKFKKRHTFIGNSSKIQKTKKTFI